MEDKRWIISNFVIISWKNYFIFKKGDFFFGLKIGSFNSFVFVVSIWEWEFDNVFFVFVFCFSYNFIEICYGIFILFVCGFVSI